MAFLEAPQRFLISRCLPNTHPGLGRDDVAELTRTETFALTAIAYLQPVTRGEIRNSRGARLAAT